MIKYLVEDEWKVIEDQFHPQYQRSSESIFSIGNGRFGQRANFEETYSGDHLQGSYIAGVYYPDKTRVGWWKNGYPEYFAKVLNSINWIGIRVFLDELELDLNTCEVLAFRRELDMKSGMLRRWFEVKLSNGKKIAVEASRFCSMSDDETAAISYRIKAVDAAHIRVESYLDGDVANEDTNWDERFWLDRGTQSDISLASAVVETKKTDFLVAASMITRFNGGGAQHSTASAFYVNQTYAKNLQAGEELHVEKFVGIVNSLNYTETELLLASQTSAKRISELGFEAASELHRQFWDKIWAHGDIRIEGDIPAQQGIRFNIFHLNQTYTGEDARLNIGPKGFTGEKYGGSTYWDTEAYCLPFYLNTHPAKVGRQLLVYRYNQLGKAIENAEKLGFVGGAALYPMVTMNGEECHNEWEITFEEIHRNGAIAFGIYNYIRHTGDRKYMAEYGFDVLLGICRFWAQRVNWSSDKDAYVMLGVTGPNEYENNVNNNWYTNYLAKWCLTYGLKSIIFLKESYPQLYSEKTEKWSFNEAEETSKWAEIIESIYLPQIDGTNIRLQQDGYLDKAQHLVSDLKESDRPINQKWSWDRILRSPFIKQADVLQGIYLFEHHFDLETIKNNFEFYEPRTVHESSLSPCVHVILAAKIGALDKAYELYLRTARLDLDDYNHEAYQGLHITAMAGTWMSVVEGFGGLRFRDGLLKLSPVLPKAWKAYSFRISFRERTLLVEISQAGTKVSLETGESLEIELNGQLIRL
jgi:maltose phosphorylase